MPWAAQSEQGQTDLLTSLVLEALLGVAEPVCPCLQHALLQRATQITDKTCGCCRHSLHGTRRIFVNTQEHDCLDTYA